MSSDLYSEVHTDDEETQALAGVAQGEPYLFLAFNVDMDPPRIRVITGNGPENTNDIRLLLRAALNQLPGE